MGNRASIRMKGADKEASEGIYLHWGGDSVGTLLMAAEAEATSTDPDQCLTLLENIALQSGLNPSREPLGELGAGTDAGDFVVDVSNPRWKVELVSEYGYGLRGESKYHFNHVEFRVPDDPNGYPEKDGRTYNHTRPHLFNAVSEGDERMVQALLEAGANPNLTMQQNGGNSPLHLAAYNHDGARIARMLIDAGAKLDLVNDRGKTPKDIAQDRFGSKAVLEVIQEQERFLEAQRRREDLSKIASQCRPQDDNLVSPEQALAARQRRGRMM